MQKFSDAPMAACPDCNGPVAKLISATSFSLKGGGWYTSDYKRPAGCPVKTGEAPAHACGNACGCAAKS